MRAANIAPDQRSRSNLRTRPHELASRLLVTGNARRHRAFIVVRPGRLQCGCGIGITVSQLLEGARALILSWVVMFGASRRLCRHCSEHRKSKHSASFQHHFHLHFSGEKALVAYFATTTIVGETFSCGRFRRASPTHKGDSRARKSPKGCLMINPW